MLMPAVVILIKLSFLRLLKVRSAPLRLVCPCASTQLNDFDGFLFFTCFGHFDCILLTFLVLPVRAHS